MKKYLRLARFDHWIKNLFVFPGTALAIGYQISKGSLEIQSELNLHSLIIGFLGLCLVSSANYTINEWLDRHEDKLHPYKDHRSAVGGNLKPLAVWVQYGLLSVVGLGLGLGSGIWIFTFCLILWLMGIIYNVKPLRTKNIAYLDVISESVNNPIRMAVGWHFINSGHAVPASAFVAFWGGGIFLMGLKRYSEMSIVKDQALLQLFRKSFSTWTVEKLLTFSITGGLISSTFLGILLAGYRIEYILCLPIIILLFNQYLSLTLNQNRMAREPEKLWKVRKLHLLVWSLVLFFGVFSFVNVPLLEELIGFK